MKLKTATTILLLLLTAGMVSAQTNLTGGTNIMQHWEQQWKHVSSETFEVNYYSSDPVLAALASKMAEESLYDVCKLLDFRNRSRYAIYIFQNHADLAQSNMFPEKKTRSGGITPLRNNTLPIVYPGSYKALQKEIRKVVSQMVIEDYYFGGNLQKSVQNTVLLSIPEWYMEGLTAYIGEGWSVEDEWWLSSLANTDLLEFAQEGNSEFHKIARKSIWYFIGSQYGVDKLSEIFYMVRLTRSAEDGIIHVLGITLKTLTERWREFVLQRLVVNNNGRQDLDEVSEVLPLEAGDQLLAFSPHPTESKVAMLLEKTGFQRLVIHDFGTGITQETPVEGGFLTDQFEGYTRQLKMAWSPDGNFIATQIYRNGTEELAFLNLKSNLVNYNSYRKQLDKLIDFSWSPDGKKLIGSALRQGAVDLYRFTPGGSGFAQVTNDPFDNLSPVWSLDGQRIYYSSNRLNDTIQAEEVRYDIYRENLDIWELNLEDKSIRRVTETPLSDEYPVTATSSFELLVRNDQNGIFNLEKLNVFLGQSTWNTNVARGFGPTQTSETEVFFSLPVQGRIRVAHANTDQFNAGEVLENTLLRTLHQEFYESVRLAKERKRIQDSLLANPAKVETPVEETPVPDADSTAEKPEEKPAVKYYVFDEEDTETPRQARKKLIKSRQVLKRTEPIKPDYNAIQIKSPSRTKARWTVDQLSTRLGFDPIFRLNMLLEAKLKDQQGDRTLVAGFRPYWNLRSSDTYVGYGNRRHKVDYFLGLNRQTRFLNRFDFAVRYNATQVYGFASMPFNRFLSVGAGLSASYINRYNLLILIPRNIDGNDLFAGGRLNLTYDRRDVRENFVAKGTYARVDVTNAFSVENSRNEFLTGSFDIRKYMPLRKLVLAGRVSGAWSTGNTPQRYFLGGTDQWLFSQFTNPSDYPIESDLASFHFMEFVTPVHGFQFNARNGSKFFAANAELRIPASRILRTSLSSNPLYNVELIPFFDIGTAWDVGNPLSQKNPIDTETIDSYPLSITVQTLKSPFVMGFGAGARMMLLGYDVRMDLGWGVEDYTVLNPRLHVSLGKNF